MKWDMEIEEIEVILEKIWDLHDKLSEAIHSISRAHFLSSVKNSTKSDNKNSKLSNHGSDDNPAPGFVFFKEFRIDVDDSAIHEAKSLNSIRSALENLEDQLEFLHTMQVQQLVERDAAVARIEQSRMILAMRLAEHHGKNYKVIDEALAFIGDVHSAAKFVSPQNQHGLPLSPNGQKPVANSSNRSNPLIKMLYSTLSFATKAFKLDHVNGILGNAAMVAISMIAFLHLHQVAYKESPERRETVHLNRTFTRTSQQEVPSQNKHFGDFDVLSARG